MAWFTYTCPDHGDFKISLPKREGVVVCPICHNSCKAKIKAGTMRVVEQLDNGAMARKVERLHNIEEIMEERNAKHSIKQDDE